jgi:hypothetical protein
MRLVFAHLTLPLLFWGHAIWCKPIPIATILTPAPWKHDGGQTEPDFSKVDLELTLWRTGKHQTLESKIDVSQVNQETLPTDANGRLLPEARALTDRPFIRYYLPGTSPVTIDVNCTRKQCKGIWSKSRIQFSPKFRFKIEVNIRGLKGKNWVAGLQSAFVANDSVLPRTSISKTISAIGWTGDDVLWPPTEYFALDHKQVKIQSVDEWTFSEIKSTTPWKRNQMITRFAILEGELELQLSNGDYVEIRSLKSGDVLWIPNDLLYKISNRGLKARLLATEYVGLER